jgi:hypothetical protein
MSLPSRCVADTIARSIALAMKLPGGRMSVLIRPSLLERYGWKRTRCRQFQTKRESKTRPRESSTTAIGKAPGIIGRHTNEVEMSDHLIPFEAIIRKIGFVLLNPQFVPPIARTRCQSL